MISDRSAAVRLFTLFTLALAVLFGATPFADAALVLIDFNSPSIDEKSSKDAATDKIDTYVSALWGSKVNVLGGAKADDEAPEDLGQRFLGNTEHFTGRGGSGISEGPGGDGYLYNLWRDDEDRITMVFDEGVYGFSLDWQIFPITKSSDDKADFKILVYASASGPGVQIFYDTLEAKGNPDREKGKLGVFSTFGTVVAPAGGWHKIEFVDWNSAPIGIDNLLLDPDAPPPPLIPEPGTIALLGAGLLVLGLRARARLR